MESSANSGNITTEYFGQYLDEEKVERDIYYKIDIYPPKSAKSNANVTLTLLVKKVSIQDSDDADKAEMMLNFVYPIKNSLNDWTFPFREAFYKKKRLMLRNHKVKNIIYTVNMV